MLYNAFHPCMRCQCVGFKGGSQHSHKVVCVCVLRAEDAHLYLGRVFGVELQGLVALAARPPARLQHDRQLLFMARQLYSKETGTIVIMKTK